MYQKLLKLKTITIESCSSRVSKKRRQAQNLAIDKKYTIVIVKLGENIHPISTLYCWNISLIGSKLWNFY